MHGPAYGVAVRRTIQFAEPDVDGAAWPDHPLCLRERPRVVLATTELAPQFELRHHRRGEVGQDRAVVVAPHARRTVDHGQGAQHLAISCGEWNTQVCDGTDVQDRGVVADERVRSRILHHEWRIRPDHVPTEGVGQRRLSRACPRLRQPGAAREELALRVDHRHDRDWRVEHPGREPGQPIEGRLGRRIEQPGVVERRKTGRIGGG